MTSLGTLAPLFLPNTFLIRDTNKMVKFFSLIDKNSTLGSLPSGTGRLPLILYPSSEADLAGKGAKESMENIIRRENKRILFSFFDKSIHLLMNARAALLSIKE